MSSRTHARRTGYLLGCGLLLWLAWQVPVVTQDVPPAHDLASLFAVGGVLDDRNGDGLADAVSAAFVLAETPTADEVAAAAEVAARVGFETASLDLPLSRELSAPVLIVIGHDALARLELDLRQLELPRLGRGDGLVRSAVIDGRQYILVLGGDGPGLRAAARTLAARVPYLWALGGTTYAEVERDVQTLLAAAKVTGATVAAPELHVKAGAQELERVVVVVRLSSLSDMTGAMFALQRVQQARDRTANRDRSTTLSYPGVQVVSIRLGSPDSPSVNIDLPRSSSSTLGEAPTSASMAASKDDLDLSNLFTTSGLLGDADRDEMPDQIDAAISPTGEGISRTIDLAARLGLESTGIIIPLVTSPEHEDSERENTLVVIGTSHPVIDQLEATNGLELPTLAAGQGVVQVVRNAFGRRHALIVTGADADGVDRALAQLAERLPHVWERGPDRSTLDDVERDLGLFLSGRSPAGQAALALYKSDQLLARLADKPIASLDLAAYLERPDPNFRSYLDTVARQRVAAGTTVTTSVHALDVGGASPLTVGGTPLAHELTIDSEVDELRQIFDTKILRGARRGRPFRLEARLSEPASVREKLAADLRAQLLKKGLKDADVSISVLSAFRQGYSWIVDEVRPALADRSVDTVTIQIADGPPPPPGAPNVARARYRWVDELMPADEVLAQALGIALDHVTIERGAADAPIYRAVAKDGSGRVVLDRTFDPKYVMQPRFARLPDYDVVPVATGWVTATSDRRTLVDQRVRTDVERFWDAFQTRTLEGLHDYALARYDGRPRPPGAPLFGTLTVDVSLSEPDEAVGRGLERLAPLESLHEEIVVGTRQFLSRTAQAAGRDEGDALGRIVPLMRPTADGGPGKMRVSATGFDVARPVVRVSYTTTDGQTGQLALEVPEITVERPSAFRLIAGTGHDGIGRLDMRLHVDSEHDEREALVRRAPPERVDATVLSAAQVEAVIGHLRGMRSEGVYPNALAYRGLGELRVEAVWDLGGRARHARVASLPPNGIAPPSPSLEPRAADTIETEPRETTSTDVQTNSPISPDQARAVMAALSARHQEVTAYAIGNSYLGEPVWVMDLTAPVFATHVSQAKTATSKPTAVFSGRLGGTEASSTTHLLQLADALLEEPSHRAMLDKLNVVIHPVANPDGARLADTFWRATPHYLSHAATTGAVGHDLSTAVWNGDTAVPELTHRPALWRRWTPDVMVTARGAPSHDWTPLFSSGPTTGANEAETNYVGGRGLFTSHFSYLDDPGYPRHKPAALALRDHIAARLQEVPSIEHARGRALDRARRVAALVNEGDSHVDPSSLVGAAISTSVKGERANPEALDAMARHPGVTFWTGTSRALDEGTSGEAFAQAVAAGLAFDLAILDWLADQPATLERREQVSGNGVWLRWLRSRPPLGSGPARPDRTTATTARPQ